MRNIGSKDFASFLLAGKLGEGALESLSLLYAPIVGATSIGVYHAFYAFASSGRASMTFETISMSLSLSYRDLTDAMKTLEALGLLKTSLLEDESLSGYWVEVYPPLSPRAFLSDLLLAGKLYEILGRDHYEGLKKCFARKKIPAKAKDISSTFQEIYGKNVEPVSDSFKGGVKDKPNELVTGFDRAAFAEGFTRQGFSAKSLTEEEIAYCEKAFAFYGFQSLVIGEFAADSIRMDKNFGEKLDKAAFVRKCQNNVKAKYLRTLPSGASEVSSDSDLANKARLLDTMAPAQFLSMKQHGHKPAASDMRLIHKLHYEIGLPSAAINALLDYVLTTNDNVLNAALTEKIAASMVREGIDNSRDAMDYLYSVKTKKRNASFKKNTKQQNIVSTPVKNVEDDEEDMSDEELAALMESLYGKKGK